MNIRLLVYSRVWAPLKKWAGALIKRIRKDDNNDDIFNHPYAIL
jgi:hypothetical protein